MHGEKTRLRLRFTGSMTNLYAPGMWSGFGRRMITLHRNKRSLVVSARSVRALVRQERNMLRGLMQRRKSKAGDPKSFMNKKGIVFRIMVLRALAVLLKKKKGDRTVHLYMDRLSEADESAEAMIRYAEKCKAPRTRNYFIIMRDSPDYARLKKDGLHVVRYRSFRHLCLLFIATTMITSFPEDRNITPFKDTYGKYLNDRMTYYHISVIHGIDKENLSWYQNTMRKNTRLWTAAAERERAFVMRHYNMTEKVAVNTGLPRYDKLSKPANPSKTILLMPTWRSDLSTPLMNGNRVYNEAFKESDFFHRWNDFLKDPRLEEILRDNSYTLVFRPHSNLLPQIGDFELNRYTRVEAGKNLSDLKNEADALITDYSSVFFDFAYMDKPVFYYQFDAYHHDRSETYFSYEEDGFGPIAMNTDELIELIAAAIKSEMKNPELYRRRADIFFTHRDHDNCKRVWAEIQKLLL
jgi:CDP-glycerol glycerophosphotransferase (TagB/SpsB family)